MLNPPLVSIIIPTYNRAHLIGETLDSVLAQTYTNWECLVVDDGSTDNTAAVLLAYCKKDARIHYHHRPENRPKGANACRNYGFELSKGAYINWFDSDDIFSKNKIHSQVDILFGSNGDVSTCKWGRFNSLSSISIKSELRIYKTYSKGVELIRDYGRFNEYFPQHVFLIKRELVCKSGYWNEYLQINQDGEFFCRLLIHAKKIIFSKNSYVLYRENDICKTSRVSNINKAKHLVISWRLIESYLCLLNKKEFEEYLENGKDYCFEKLKINHYDLLLENKYFFREHFKKRNLLSKLKRKLS